MDAELFHLRTACQNMAYSLWGYYILFDSFVNHPPTPPTRVGPRNVAVEYNGGVQYYRETLTIYLHAIYLAPLVRLFYSNVLFFDIFYIFFYI